MPWIRNFQWQLSACLRADVSYFLCCTRATKEIGDVCTQANYLLAIIQKFLSLFSLFSFRFFPFEQCSFSSLCTAAPSPPVPLLLFFTCLFPWKILTVRRLGKKQSPQLHLGRFWKATSRWANRKPVCIITERHFFLLGQPYIILSS